MATYYPPDEEHLVEQYENDFIERVENVGPVLEELLRDKLLISEQYIAASNQETNRGKMSVLLKTTRSWSNAQKDQLLQTLKSTNPSIVQHIEMLSYDEVSSELAHYGKELQREVKHHFRFMKDRNSLMGERALLQKRYTPLVMLKRLRSEEERRQEISSSGKAHEKVMDERAADCSHTTFKKLFDPDGDGVVPKTVVLRGPAGIGKSMTAHMISLEWANGSYYPDRFQFLFYLSYKDFYKLNQDTSLAAYLAKMYHWNCSARTMAHILSRSEKILFLINGYDCMKITSEGEVCDDPFKKVHKEVLLRSLLKRCLAKDASFLITTRPYALEKMKKVLVDQPSFVDILGYTAEAREQYIRVYYRKETQAERAVEFLRNNDVLFTMCHVPFMCWVVSTVTQQEIAKYPLQYKGDSCMFLYYLKGTLKYHNKNVPENGFLRKLCALANEGLANGKVFFDDKDLERHDISLDSGESGLLGENTFHDDIGKRSYYSFIHHSVQEYLAMVYYALPQQGESSNRILHHFLPEVCKGKSLLDLLEKHPHLALTVKFLFGLSNQKLHKDFNKFVGTALSFHASTAMGNWLLGDEPCELGTEVMNYLHETQDEEFVRKLMSRIPELKFSQCQRNETWVSDLAFCLKACEGKKVTLSGYTLGGIEMTMLALLLHKCPQVCFRSCRFLQDENVKPEKDQVYPTASDRGYLSALDQGYGRRCARASRPDPRHSDPWAWEIDYVMASNLPRSSNWAYSRAARRAQAMAAQHACEGTYRMPDWPYAKAVKDCSQGPLFKWLLDRESNIRELCLWGCDLPPLTCQQLSTALTINSALTTLCVMFKISKKEERDEMSCYQGMPRSHQCRTMTRKMLGKTWFILQIQRKGSEIFHPDVLRSASREEMRYHVGV